MKNTARKRYAVFSVLFLEQPYLVKQILGRDVFGLGTVHGFGRDQCPTRQSGLVSSDTRFRQPHVYMIFGRIPIVAYPTHVHYKAIAQALDQQAVIWSLNVPPPSEDLSSGALTILALFHSA
jgi:hypothetical protein